MILFLLQVGFIYGSFIYDVRCGMRLYAMYQCMNEEFKPLNVEFPIGYVLFQAF